MITQIMVHHLKFNEAPRCEAYTRKQQRGGWKATFQLQKECRTAKIWDWGSISSLFQALKTPVCGERITDEAR